MMTRVYLFRIYKQHVNVRILVARYVVDSFRSACTALDCRVGLFKKLSTIHVDLMSYNQKTHMLLTAVLQIL